MRKLVAVAVATVVVAAASVTVVTPASAETIRYASSGGVGVACSQAEPCSLETAISSAPPNSTVQLAAEEYYPSAPIAVSVENLTIQGPDRVNGPSDFIPYIFFSGPLAENKILVQANNVAFKRLAIVGETGNSYAVVGAGFGRDTTYDRVLVQNSGSGFGVSGTGITISNSFVEQTGSGTSGSAINGFGMIYGTTAYSRNGSAIRLDDNYTVAPYCSAVIRNTLAWGGWANLYLDNGGVGCMSLDVNYDYSWIPDGDGQGGGIRNFSGPVTAGPHNLPNLPAVLSPSTSDPRNLVLPADSPAINAGCTTGCSDHDYYGRPRPIGSANDIGAMEQSLAPLATEPTVETVASTRAELRTSIKPRGENTTYTTQYRRVGTSEWSSGPSGTLTTNLFGSSPVVAPITALTAATDYEVRVAMTNDRGSYTTPAVNVRTTSPPTVTVSGLKAKVSKTKAKLVANAVVSAPGKITQTATTGKAAKKKTRCSTSRTVSVAGTYKLTCSLSKKTRKELRKRSLKFTVMTGLKTADDPQVMATSKLKVRSR